MPLMILQAVMTLLCVVHIVRTGRQTFWVYIVIFVPMLGTLAYLVAEVIPEWLRGPDGQRAAARARAVIDPERAYRAAHDLVVIAPTTENRKRLAEECLELGRAEEAATLYRGALEGAHRDDPALLSGLARAEFARSAYERALEALDQVKASDPAWRSEADQMIRARCLEGLGRPGEALAVFEALSRVSMSPEARCRQAQLLHQLGREEEARVIFAQVVQAARRLPRHLVREHRAWIEVAERGLAT